MLSFATPVISGVAWCAWVPLQRGGTYFDLTARSQRRLISRTFHNPQTFLQFFIY